MPMNPDEGRLDDFEFFMRFETYALRAHLLSWSLACFLLVSPLSDRPASEGARDSGHLGPETLRQLFPTGENHPATAAN